MVLVVTDPASSSADGEKRVLTKLAGYPLARRPTGFGHSEQSFSPYPPSDESEDEEAERDRVANNHREFLRSFDAYCKNNPSSIDIPDLVNRLAKPKSSLEKPGDAERTILYKLTKLTPGRISLFKWLMEAYPSLYQKHDEHGVSVLALAVRRKHESFLKFFVRGFPKQTAELIKSDKDLMHKLLPIVMDVDSELLFNCLDKETMMHRDGAHNTVLHIAARYDKSTRQHEPQLRLIEHLIKFCPEALTSVNNDKQSPYQYRVASYLEGITTSDSGTGDSSHEDHNDLQPLHDDAIAMLLKDNIMHLKERDETIRLLHGAVQEREIHFDLLELANLNLAVSAQDLTDLITSLKFENILQYVRIPRYKLSAHSSPARGDSRSDQQRGGRRDFQLIFDLLWKKGVRTIIKVIVEDDDETPHSDEVIEKLAIFNIEEWDWRKVDLCSEVIYKAAGNVEKAFLYSSGNNAVLRSWSGIDGLKRLEQLSEVHLFIRRRFESQTRTQAYLEGFIERMAVNCPKVRVHTRIQEDTGHADGQSWFPGLDKVETNAWLENMDKFAKFVVNLPPEVVPRRDVKVAVIDDGIDKLQGGFGDSISDGVSFYTPPGTFDTKPYYFSSSGHGTLMAKLIRRICPKAQLYIARLEEGQTTGQPTAESAAKAINWAINKGVDIISMSWTIVQTEENQEDIKKLKAAIKEAHNAHILMFGAASDQGFNNTSPTYPASMPEVFCIGAAKLSGHTEDMAASESLFVFPGGSVGIKSLRAPPHTADAANSEMVSGSSFATALASGFTALILYCVEICEYGEEYRDGLQEFDIMKKVFQTMTQHNQQYIAVKDYFKPVFERLDWDSGRKKLDVLVQFIIRPCADRKNKFLSPDAA
ncbi:MAG: hypothetical protein M1839_002591 [Geoglossum umbratile]|nr:MAG: hypothetical protein M1839_002591 [Geoglossum umbratile]